MEELRSAWEADYPGRDPQNPWPDAIPLGAGGIRSARILADVGRTRAAKGIHFSTELLNLFFHGPHCLLVHLEILFCEPLGELTLTDLIKEGISLCPPHLNHFYVGLEVLACAQHPCFQLFLPPVPLLPGPVTLDLLCQVSISITIIIAIISISKNMVICNFRRFMPIDNNMPNSYFRSSVIIKKVPNIPKAITMYKTIIIFCVLDCFMLTI